MQYTVNKRDGPARIGELFIANKKIVTPTILFFHTSRFKAPDFADIIITPDDHKTKKPAVRLPKKIFSSMYSGKKAISTVDNYFVYPKDLPKEVHLAAIQEHTIKKTNCYVIPSNPEIIDAAVHDNDALMFIVAHATQLFSQQSRFVAFMTELREKIGYQRMIYLPAICSPTNIALFTYMGIDIFDSVSAILAARNNKLFHQTGMYDIRTIEEIPCSCPICSKFHGKPSEMNLYQLLHHNYLTLFNEVKLVRNAIAHGSLRELVEMKVRADPGLTAILRHLDFDRYYFLEERTPIMRKHQLLATTKESLFRPEVRRFQERVIDRYRKPKSGKILLLLPCSAKKPYSFSKSHKLFRERLYSIKNPHVIHEVIVTSPLGLVPRELELMYPASSYDIPVTGLWDEDEKKIIRTMLQQYLKRNMYDRVIMHVPLAIQEFIVDLLQNPISTCLDMPTSPASLDELSNVLMNITNTYNPVHASIRAYENIHALASYQFGIKTAEILLKDCTIAGKYPYQKILYKNRQVGIVTEERGMISLTMEGAQRLADSKEYWVEIYDDFTLKGSVFVPGIKNADSSIRVGDEVVVIKNNKAIAVGIAQMNRREMATSCRGEAVKTRHTC